MEFVGHICRGGAVELKISDDVILLLIVGVVSISAWATDAKRHAIHVAF